MVPVTLTTIGVGNLYQLDTNPLIARIEVEKKFGVSSSQLSTAFSTAVDQGPTLSIFETKPVESNLELFYEINWEKIF